MKVAFLVNQYPHVSHTFVRREILALELRGHDVKRITVRRSTTPLVDPLDHAEARATYALLEAPAIAAILVVLKLLLVSPCSIARTVGRACGLMRSTAGGRIRHLAYIVEAILLVDFCRRRGIGHVHAHFGTNSASVVLLAKQMGSITYSLTVHGPEEFDSPVGLSLQRKIAEAEFVVAISSFCRSQLMRWSRVDDWDKIHVVGCTVDEQFFDQCSPVVASADTIVCVGRLSPQKGHLVLVDAFAEAVSHGLKLKLVLAGDGELRPVIEERIRQKQLENVIHITGWVTGAQVRELLLGSRGLVLASFAEGLPVVIMEAMALGRPVISTYVAGIPELVRHLENGWLVPAGQRQALAEAIGAIARTSATELTEMGRQATRDVRASHSVRTEVDKLESLLSTVC